CDIFTRRKCDIYGRRQQAVGCHETREAVRACLIRERQRRVLEDQSVLVADARQAGGFGSAEAGGVPPPRPRGDAAGEPCAGPGTPQKDFAAAADCAAAAKRRTVASYQSRKSTGMFSLRSFSDF